TVRSQDGVKRTCTSTGRPVGPAVNVDIRTCFAPISNLARCPKRGSQERVGSSRRSTDATARSCSADAPSMSSQQKPPVARRSGRSAIETGDAPVFGSKTVAITSLDGVIRRCGVKVSPRTHRTQLRESLSPQLFAARVAELSQRIQRVVIQELREIAKGL